MKIDPTTGMQIERSKTGRVTIMDAGEAYLQAWANKVSEQTWGKKLSELTAEQIGELKRALSRLQKAVVEAETSPKVLAAKAETQKAKMELAESNEQWGEEYCTEIPQDYYEVERLAARAGVPIEWLDEGNWERTWARIEGYLLSVKDSRPSELKAVDAPVLTPPMTKTCIGEIFDRHRNTIDNSFLSQHKSRKLGARFQFPVSEMPDGWESVHDNHRQNKSKRRK